MNVLIYWGGWEGHTPRETAEVFANVLVDAGADVAVEDHTRALDDPERLAELDLVIPCWTMAKPGEITDDQVKNLSDAVRGGLGLAGVHGGTGDSVRHSRDYQWMVGGQFVGHPHVGDYAVRVIDGRHPVMAGLPAAFPYRSEQYYMLVDPDIDVLAVTDYCWNDSIVEVPVVWTRRWGAGRVFYSSLGHVAEEFGRYPRVLSMTVAGMFWSARGGAADCGDEDGEDACGCGHHHG